MIGAAAVWCILLVATFGLFFWLNNATGQMTWQEYQQIRESRDKIHRPQ